MLPYNVRYYGLTFSAWRGQQTCHAWKCKLTFHSPSIMCDCCIVMLFYIYMMSHAVPAVWWGCVTLIAVPHLLFHQMGKTALHDASVQGNAEMVAYMMEQVNPNVVARDVVGRTSWVLNCAWSLNGIQCRGQQPCSCGVGIGGIHNKVWSMSRVSWMKS